MRIYRKTLLLLFLVMSVSSYAAVLQVSGGQLIGATGVNVNGSYYDVSFVEGTCADVYDGCNNAWDFIFSSTTATLAAQALLDQVFIGSYDDNPSLTFGCSAAPCNVYVAYDTNLFDYPFVKYAINNAISQAADSVGSGSLTNYWNSTSVNTAVWASFAPSAVVPVPAAAWLFGSAIVGLVAMRTKRARAVL